MTFVFNDIPVFDGRRCEQPLLVFNNIPAPNRVRCGFDLRVFNNIPASKRLRSETSLTDSKGHSGFTKMGFVHSKRHSGFTDPCYFIFHLSSIPVDFQRRSYHTVVNNMIKCHSQPEPTQNSVDQEFLFVK